MIMEEIENAIAAAVARMNYSDCNQKKVIRVVVSLPTGSLCYCILLT